jgi:galactokinase
VPREVRAFAPGRVNLIGEHTDYNGGLALPFAIVEGIAVRGRATDDERIRAHAVDLGEYDEFALGLPERREGWRAFVRGTVTELSRVGVAVPAAELEIEGAGLPRGAGLSSSAALTVALALALLALADRAELDGRVLAKLCSRVENEWVGARTGLLDQLASLFGEPDSALCIDFQSLDIQPVPLVLDAGWRLVTLDSGETRTLAASGYNERRAECARACELLGVSSLREATTTAGLPARLEHRARHVLEENARVLATVTALRGGDLRHVGALLNDSHTSLRDLYECSTPAVEAAAERLRLAGAAGARMIGGGFGGHVLALFPPGASPPPGTREVRPARGAHICPA